MWIIPKILQLSSGAPDTAGFISDLNEQSQICASSLMVRSKPSQPRIWSQKWRRDSWTQHLSGRILRPSHAKPFETEWTCLWPVIPASHFQRPESDSEPKTLGTSGPTSPEQFELFDLDSVSLRMSKDTSPSDSERSSESWKALVIKARGEYSARVKSARLTSGSGSSSWPTTAARDYKGTSPGYLTRKDGKSRADQLAVAVDLEEKLSWPTPTVQEAGKIGNQANHGQLALSNHPAIRGEVSRDKYEKGKHGQAVPANSNTNGSRQGSWASPTSCDHKGATTPEACKQWESRGQNLPEQAASITAGKLNPRWVETLMGLPVGWTMPSCASPVTIARTSCASSATESCQQQQSELLEF